ncbi:hypothetical protein [Aeromonas sp. MrichA-1]|uniref:hypothetical protein n=1 Tax=Aeromonas sp. MrichA-1 TaxID=2823362 RepID=UPI001B31BB8F|nr:hypothetical protein [Aeromonas sp. MrichA-1]MBP4081695.1 hypothetical protein [Aeromonas sp. MrichA-1]
MMYDLEKWNNKVLFNKIMDVLEEKFGQLPVGGVFAGQAVASALYEVVGLPIQGRYKDLDVFLRGAFEYRDYDVKDGVGTYLVRSDVDGGLTIESSFANELMTGPFPKSTYQIIASSTAPENEKINNIHISTSGVQGEDLAKTIIKSFDINAVQVALDVRKRTVCWTPEFQDFIYTRQLKASWCGTPIHTSVRLMNKASEMGNVFFSEKEELRKLQTIKGIVNEYQKKNDTFVPGNLFSDVYQERYAKLEDRLSKYWTKETVFLDIESKDPEVDPYQDSYLVKKRFVTLNPKNSCENTVDFASRNEMYLYTTNEIEGAYSAFSRVYDAFNGGTESNKVMSKYFNELNISDFEMNSPNPSRARIQAAVEICFNKDLNFSSQKELDSFIEKYVKIHDFNFGILNALSGSNKEKFVGAVDNISYAIDSKKELFLNSLIKDEITLDVVSEMTHDKCDDIDAYLWKKFPAVDVKPVIGTITDSELNSKEFFNCDIYQEMNGKITLQEITNKRDSLFADSALVRSIKETADIGAEELTRRQISVDSWKALSSRKEILFKATTTENGKEYHSLISVIPVSHISKKNADLTSREPVFNAFACHDFCGGDHPSIAKDHELAAIKMEIALTKKAMEFDSVYEMLKSVSDGKVLGEIDKTARQEQQSKSHDRDDLIPF